MSNYKLPWENIRTSLEEFNSWAQMTEDKLIEPMTDQKDLIWTTEGK